jgi:predicted dehydrogenase
VSGPLHFGQLRFLLVGAGGIAQAYAQVLRNHPRGRIAGVVDIRPAAAQALAEFLGCGAYKSVAEVAWHSDFDAAIICTPPSTHAEIALECIAHDLHVLCEKPLCLDLASARAMYAAAARYGKLLAMASKFRYTDDVIHARTILASGMLGEVSLARNVFAAPVKMAGRWNSDRAISGGGVLIDNGTHSVDLIRYLVGPIQQIFACEARRPQRLPVEETVHMSAHTDSGVLASIDLSWSTPDASPDYVQISCSEGAMAIGWSRSAYRRHPGAEWVQFGRGYSKFDALTKQLDNFIAAVAGEEVLRISESDALASVEVVSAAYRSLATNEWQNVHEWAKARAAFA